MNFRQRYQFEVKNDLIGKGGFSKVYRAWDTVRKRNVALKFFYGEWSEKYDVIGEINRMEDLVHPNLIRYYDATVITSKSILGEDEKIQVGIMEYADYGDISKLFRTDNLITIRRVISQLLEGLSFLHNNQIVHRDLKPKNVLLSLVNDELVAKIADFGISKKVGAQDNDHSTQLLGSIEYMAPEQFNAKKYGINGQLSTNVDLWSVGIIIYELFTQSTPFGNRSTGLTNEEILNNILFNPIEINYTKLQEPYKSMVRVCLQKNAFDRVKSAQELIEMLNNKQQTAPEAKKPADTSNDIYETQVLPNPKELIDRVEQSNIEKQKLAEQKNTENIKPIFDFEKEVTEIVNLKPLLPTKPLQEDQPQKAPQETEKTKPTFTPTSYSSYSNYENIDNIHNGSPALELGKKFFKEKDYINSYRYFKPHHINEVLDTESKFYVGYMLYNGKCGGDYDPSEGKKLMDQAKLENRTLVMELMVKYILNN